MGKCLVCQKEGSEQWFMWDSLTNKEPFCGSVQCKTTLFTSEFQKDFNKTHIPKQPHVEVQTVVGRRLVSKLTESVVALFEQSKGKGNDTRALAQGGKDAMKKVKKDRKAKYTKESLEAGLRKFGSIAALAKAEGKNYSTIFAAIRRYNAHK